MPPLIAGRLPLLLALLVAARLALGATPAPAPVPAPVPAATAPTPPAAATAPTPAVAAVTALKPESNRRDAAVLAVAKVLPAVVNISTERMVTQQNRSLDPFDAFASPFDDGTGGEPRSTTVNSLGSGVIVDRRGLVLTNNHVVQRASRIIVTLADGHNYDAAPVATDETNDLALLKLEGLEAGTTLSEITFAVPDDLLLGETVVTVGNPFGLGHSVARGVLSAKGRHAVYRGNVLFDDILQTDAAINPGNSGGPLVNLDGELIGINLAIRADAQGIGFAIPLKRIEEMLAVWMVPRRFGLSEGGLVPGTTLAEDGQPQVVVRQLLADTPAAGAALKVGDVIAKINGTAVRQAIEASRLLWPMAAGDSVELELIGGEKVSYKLFAVKPLSGPDLAKTRLALEVQELTPRLATALHLPAARGLVVSNVEADSVLARRGVQRGDVIIQLGETPVSNFADLARALEAVRPGDVAPLIIDRVQQARGRTLVYRYVIAVPL